MKTSAEGRAQIELREGRVLHTYLDTKGIATCCVGHTGRMSPPTPKMGQTFTEEECDAFLASDLGPVEAVINSAVKVPISQDEFDAMASLGFNIGAGGLKTSQVIKRLNLGDVQGAANAFMNWSKPASLIGRRKGEMKQFLQPHEGVTASRASVLVKKAGETKDKANAATAGGAGLLVISGTTAAMSHGHIGWIMGGLVGVAGIFSLAAAAFGHNDAATLAANASKPKV